MTGVVEFVLGSDARREVLGHLADAPASSRAVVRASHASESAAYDALARLGDRGLAVEAENGEWRLTGAGRLVAEAVGRCTALGEVVASDVDYWAAHDVTGLPERFRRSIDRLAGCEVVRSPDTDPYRAGRRGERAIREAESVAIVAPIYSDRHAEALLETDATRVRLIVTPEMIERMLRDEPDGPDGDVGDVAIRVQPASISLTVTDRELLFSLPDEDGSFDATSEVVSESSEAIRWGRRLFEHYWADGTPVVEWIARELPDSAPAARAAEVAGADPGPGDPDLVDASDATPAESEDGVPADPASDDADRAPAEEGSRRTEDHTEPSGDA